MAEPHGPSVPVELVHGLQPEAHYLRQVGVGVLAHQIQLPDLSMPAMVVVLRDGHPVHENGVAGHNRTAVLDGDEVGFVCALDWAVAQQLSELVSRAAEAVDRFEGAAPPAFGVKPLQCFLPHEMRYTNVGVTVRPLVSDGHAYALAAVLVLGDDLQSRDAPVAAFGGAASRQFATMMTRCSTRVRRARTP